MFLPFFAPRIFLFSSAILTAMHLGLDGGCHLRVGSLETLGSNNLRAASDSLSLNSLSFHGPYLLSRESSIGALGCFSYLIFQSFNLGFQIIVVFFQILEFLS